MRSAADSGFVLVRVIFLEMENALWCVDGGVGVVGLQTICCTICLVRTLIDTVLGDASTIQAAMLARPFASSIIVAHHLQGWPRSHFCLWRWQGAQDNHLRWRFRGL